MKSTYFYSLIGKIFKILPLREEIDGPEFHSYVDALWVEMSGALKLFPELWDEPKYISVLNIIGYLSMNTVDVAKCKREVFQAIDLIQKIQGGDAR